MCYIHDEDFLPLLFKLNHKVISSNKSEVNFQNVNSINLVLASMFPFFKNIKVRFVYFYRYILVDLSYEYKGKHMFNDPAFKNSEFLFAV